MEKFKISDIQEIFVSDVERFHTLTQQHVTQLLSETTPSQESLDEALRQCHTLKGLAATVEAWGLSCLGADLEKLLELAGSWMHNEREKANGIFEFILDHMQDWYVMNQFTCMDMLPQAWDVYQGLRYIMVERWPGYLPPPASADGENAHYVRLPDLEIPDLPLMAEAVDAVELATPVERLTPDLDVQDAQPMASATSPSEPATLTPPENVDVQQSEPIAHVEQPATPKPLRVVPPTLRHREPVATSAPVENLNAPTSPVAPASEPVAHAEQPATPKPLQVVPPSLRRRKETGDAQVVRTEAAPTPVAENVPTVQTPPATTAQTDLPPAAVIPPGAAENQTAESLSPTTPPILRVTPPALKRRAKKIEPTKEAGVRVAASATTPSEQISVPPLPVEPETEAGGQKSEVGHQTSGLESLCDALSAEDVFAALPAPTAEAKSVEEFKPGSDTDLLAMLSQEVAGYLADLASNLTALAANLADAAQWEQTRRLFHTIKGTAATFGLDAVSAPAKAAEARCIEAVEHANARTREAFETCLHRAHVVATALHLPFDEQPLREALATGLAQAANEAAAIEVADVPQLDPEMAGFFINDTREQIGIIEQAVLRWERLGSSTLEVPSSKVAERGTRNSELGTQLDCVNAAQRGFHTIKGAGNSIGLTAVAQSVHEVEAFLEGVAAAGALGSKPLFTFLLGAVDQLRHYLADLAKNTASPWRHDWKSAIQLFRQLSDSELGTRNAELGTGMAAVVQASLAVERSDAAGSADGADAHYLRIEAARLYQVMNLIGEMVIDRARLARKIEQLTGLQRALAERNGALAGAVQGFQREFEFNLLEGRGSPAAQAASSKSTETGTQSLELGTQSAGEFSELEFDRYDQFNVLARSLVEISHDIEQLNGEVAACLESFTAENVQFTQTSQQLQSQVTGLGLVPVNTLFPRLQRAFRDALSVEGKEADLVLAGGEVLLDKVVVDKAYAPLLHLLRNAVAHGIEAAPAPGAESSIRVQRKKPARGEVRLSAVPLANQIVIEMADDGAGVDAAAVRQRAVEKGWLAADAPDLSPEQVVHFIFQPGFSTAAKVSSVAGRGIGLDVVRQEIENLNGSVELKYEAGQGCTWTLRLPLTLSISEAVLASVGPTTFAFPLNFIEAGLILEAPTSCGGDGRELYEIARAQSAVATESVEGEPAAASEWLPVVRLSQLLHLPGDANSNKGLIVSVGERRAIVVVDVVLRRQEIVIKQLDAVMALHPLLNGASLDAEGRVIPILNLPALLKFAERKSEARSQVAEVRPATSEREPSALRVLIVDDSLSVRKVQERYLTEVGCAVTTAADGLLALEKLREQEFDFIFTDLEMPRLNGYELISELRGNPAWSAVPVVVVSSRGADKYITKAMNLGATTFLAKPFTQQQLQQVLMHYAKAAGGVEAVKLNA